MLTLTVAVANTPLCQRMSPVIRAVERERRMAKPRKVGRGSEKRDVQLRLKKETHRRMYMDHAWEWD